MQPTGIVSFQTKLTFKSGASPIKMVRGPNIGSAFTIIEIINSTYH